MGWPHAIDRERWERWLGIVSGIAAAAASAVFLGAFDRPEPPPAAREAPATSRVAGFETSRAEVEGGVRFLSRGEGFLLALSPAEARLRPACPLRRCAPIRLRLLDTYSGLRLVPQDPLPGAAYASVLYDDVYPGIGLRFVGYGGELSYAFIVDRGAGPQAIRIELDGVDGIEADAAGALVASGPGARLALPPPVAWQAAGGERVAVDVRYRVRGRQITLDVGAYDIRRPLQIGGGRGVLTDPHAAEARLP